MATDTNREAIEATSETTSPVVVEEKITKEHNLDVVNSGSGSDVEGRLRGPNGEEYPTEEELKTLRRVKGPITWIIYTIAFIELCERFAYYGTTAVCMFERSPLIG